MDADGDQRVFGQDERLLGVRRDSDEPRAVEPE